MLSRLPWYDCELKKLAIKYHYSDVIMSAMASQITSLSIAYSGADQRKYQSSASLAFVWGIRRWPVNSPHKWLVMGKMIPFDDVIMLCKFNSWPSTLTNIPSFCGICKAKIIIRSFKTNHSKIFCNYFGSGRSLDWAVVVNHRFWFVLLQHYRQSLTSVCLLILLRNLASRKNTIWLLKMYSKSTMNIELCI